MIYKLMSLAGLFALGAMVLVAGQRVKGKAPDGKAKPRVSHAELEKRQQPKDPRLEDRTVRMDDLRKNSSAEGLAPNAAGEERTKSLIGRSTILTVGSNWTIIPKGAILHVPERYKNRIDGSRQGTLIGWQEFLLKNRNWLKLQEVSLPQARGENPLSEDLLKGYQTSGFVVVAVCRGGPISVKRPKEPSGDDDPVEVAARQEQMEAQQKLEAKAMEQLKQRLLRGLR